MTTENNVTAIAVAPPQNVQLGTLQANTGAGMIVAGTEMANSLASVIDSRNLFTMIQGKKHVNVEGWTTLATMMGCLPQEVSNDEQDDGSYVAVVELVRIDDGRVLSRASGMCGDESDMMSKFKSWHDMPKYARRSMAATRATSKACRMSFSWVMALAGYQATPSEEVPYEGSPADEPHQERQSSQARTTRGPSDAQKKRMFAIGRTNGWAESDIKAYMHDNLGINSTADLTRDQYNTLCGDKDQGIHGVLEDPPTIPGELV